MNGLLWPKRRRGSSICKREREVTHTDGTPLWSSAAQNSSNPAMAFPRTGMIESMAMSRMAWVCRKKWPPRAADHSSWGGARSKISPTHVRRVVAGGHRGTRLPLVKSGLAGLAIRKGGLPHLTLERPGRVKSDAVEVAWFAQFAPPGQCLKMEHHFI